MSISPSSCVAAVNPAQNNTSYLVQELIRMGRFEDAAFLVGSLTPTELNSLDYDGNNLLHQAAATGSLALVEAVMDGLNSPEEIATVGRLGSALWIAIDGGHEEVACAIAQRMRAEDLINIKKYNCTALDWAQGRGLAQLQVSIIRQLSTLTDTLPANCLLRYQLLDRAVWMQHRQVAKELIDSLESKVDTLTAPPVLEAGWTHRPRQPLSTSPIEAPPVFRTEMLSLMCLSLAQSIYNGWVDEATALMNKLPKAWLIFRTQMDSPFFAPAACGPVQIMQAMMDREELGWRLLRDHSDRNLLHTAASCGQTKICSLILSKVDPSYLIQRDRGGCSALHHASRSSSEESYAILGQLIDAVDPEALSVADHTKNSALSYCISSSYSHGVANACQLITHMRPEDLLRPHVDGKTYLEQAMRAGKIEIADALRQHMDPQQFTQLAADLYHEAPDDDWKLLLTPMTHTKGAGV